MANLKSRLAKLENQTGDSQAARMFLLELYARWLCADSIPGETAEQIVKVNAIGPTDYDRPWPTDDAVLLQVAFDHARAEGDTTAPNAEAWRAERMAAHQSGSASLLADIEIIERAGQKKLERQLA